MIFTTCEGTKHHHDNIKSKSGTHKVNVRDEHFSIQGVLAASPRQLSGRSALGHLGARGWGGREGRGRGRADGSEGRGGREGGGVIGGEHGGAHGRGGRRQSGGG